MKIMYWVDLGIWKQTEIEGNGNRRVERNELDERIESENIWRDYLWNVKENRWREWEIYNC